ncbi:MAG: AAA family ATPase, partial [Spirochaetia bacterium]
MGDSASPARPTLDFAASHALSRRLIEGLQTVIRGKRTVLEYLVTCILAGGHLLIEDVPGLGKTTLAKTVARLVSRSRQGSHVIFRRIQFTPDLLPYDITGVDVFDPSTGKFVFSPGPVFSNVLLADEINRTTPKVQSALLEVMAEGQVTIGNKTHRLDPFFFVMATQNPVEMEGVYTLPIAQIDRFLMKLRVGYPALEVEVEIVRDDPSRTVMPEVQAVCGRDEILGAREAVGNVFCDEKLIRAA